MDLNPSSDARRLQPSSNGHYTYTRLSSTDHSIRLIRLHPDADPEAPIQCSLLDYRMRRTGGIHLYEALSYVWGNPHDRVLITVNGLYLSITRNLHKALIRLRNSTFDRVLWVDAICIDQTNLEERASQVQLMAEIYASASQVLIWLGEDDERGRASSILRLMRLIAEKNDLYTKRLCTQCNEWGSFDEEKCLYCDTVHYNRSTSSEIGSSEHMLEGRITDVLQDAIQLLHRPWFNRIWVSILRKEAC